MIKKIQFENMFSFEEKQVIEFTDKLNVIYGKNSAGKSNIILILRFLQEMITGDLEDVNFEAILNKFSSIDVASLTAQLEIDDDEYIFAVETDQAVKKSILYKRENDNYIIIFEYKDNELSSSVLKNHQLSLLNEIDFSNSNIFKAILSLKNKNSDIQKVYDYFSINVEDDEIKKFIFENDNIKQNLIKELRKVDIPISDLVFSSNKDVKENWYSKGAPQIDGIEKIPSDLFEKMVDSIPEYEMHFKYDEIEMDYKYESTGTMEYLEFLLEKYVLEKILNIKMIMLVDEFGIHLDNNLFKSLLKFYQKNLKSQLIITTHNTTILKEKMTNSNSIHIVDKELYASKVYPLSSFTDIESKEWDSLYNENRIGGKPYVRFD